MGGLWVADDVASQGAARLARHSIQAHPGIFRVVGAPQAGMDQGIVYILVSDPAADGNTAPAHAVEQAAGSGAFSPGAILHRNGASPSAVV